MHRLIGFKVIGSFLLSILLWIADNYLTVIALVMPLVAIFGMLYILTKIENAEVDFQSLAKVQRLWNGLYWVGLAILMLSISTLNWLFIEGEVYTFADITQGNYTGPGIFLVVAISVLVTVFILIRQRKYDPEKTINFYALPFDVRIWEFIHNKWFMSQSPEMMLRVALAVHNLEQEGIFNECDWRIELRRKVNQRVFAVARDYYEGIQKDYVAYADRAKLLPYCLAGVTYADAKEIIARSKARAEASEKKWKQRREVFWTGVKNALLFPFWPLRKPWDVVRTPFVVAYEAYKRMCPTVFPSPEVE